MSEQKLKFFQQNLIKRRKFLYLIGVGFTGSAVFLRLWGLQVLQRQEFNRLSAENRIRVILIPSPRGTIFDRMGEILVNNLPSFDLTIEDNDIADLDLLLKKISYLTGVKEAILRKNITLSHNLPHFPRLLTSNISYEKMAVINSYPDEFVGVNVDYNLIRNYPLFYKTSHVLGYINWASKAEIKDAPDDKTASTRKLGKAGVEGAFNRILIGSDGGTLNEVNSLGQPVKQLEEKFPTPGQDLHLSLSTKMQSFIYDSMPQNGAIIVMNADTAEVIAMVSKPGFDPNLYIEGVDEQKWKDLTENPDDPLNDRCLRGTYSPGSTFKPLMAYAGLDSKVITPETVVNCPGYFREGSQIYKCWKETGHGNVSLVSAIEQSCNVYFYTVGKLLGIDLIAKYGKQFGLGEKTGIKIPHELAGIMPDPAWKLKTLRSKWLAGETINVSIGQGHLIVTPIELITYFNCLINGGSLNQPNLTLKVSNYDSLTADAKEFLENKKQTVSLDRHALDLILEGLRLCVNSPRGTGSAAKSDLVEVSGKTGTTQVVSAKTRTRVLQSRGKIDRHYLNHGWFMGFIKNKNGQKISIVSLLENATSSYFAAAFSKKVLEEYYRLDTENLV